jgi:Type ISP C-terminal specificity domain
MRQRLLNNFDRLWIDNLNGDSRETGKTTPDGLPDPSVFSTPYNREGIRKGTAVALLVKKASSLATTPASQANRAEPSPLGRGQGEGGGLTPSFLKHATVHYRDWWGTAKREALLDSLVTPQRDTLYQAANPSASNKFSFKPSEVSAAYESWVCVDSLATVPPSLGILDNRKDGLVDIDKVRLEKQTQQYLDPNTSSVDWQASGHPLATPFARYEPGITRKKIIALGTETVKQIRRVSVRPFDTRYAFYTAVRPVWNEPRPNYVAQMTAENRAIVFRRQANASDNSTPFYWTRLVGMQHTLSTDAYFVPLKITSASDDLLGTQSSTRANLSALARNYLATLKLPEPDTDRATAELLWLHALAIGYSPAYLAANADGIRQGWPRIPLPATAAVLQASAALGAQVAALLDTETPVAGVTTPDATGQLNRDLSTIAVLTRKGGGALQPEEFGLTAGWGSGGQGAITMPGKGKLETVNVDGKASLDIYLNPTAYWHNVPPAVWGFTIGGYPVMKKWLSYRERSVLGRDLILAELKEVTHMARRLAALVALQTQLDENYEGCAAAHIAC